MADPCIEIIAVAHQRLGELRVFVQSILNQTSTNWKLNVIHDGEDADFISTMEPFASQAPNQIEYSCTPQRYNDYGHSLRTIGLHAAKGDFILLTNADNYYIPRFIEFITEAVIDVQPDIVIYDMIHSHANPGTRQQPAYSFFPTRYAVNDIDMGAAVIRRDLAQQAGFVDNSYAADAVFFEDVVMIKKDETRICKINRVMLVHN